MEVFQYFIADIDGGNNDTEDQKDGNSSVIPSEFQLSGPHKRHYEQEHEINRKGNRDKIRSDEVDIFNHADDCTDDGGKNQADHATYQTENIFFQYIGFPADRKGK